MCVVVLVKGGGFLGVAMGIREMFWLEFMRKDALGILRSSCFLWLLLLTIILISFLGVNDQK